MEWEFSSGSQRGIYQGTTPAFRVFSWQLCVCAFLLCVGLQVLHVKDASPGTQLTTVPITMLCLGKALRIRPRSRSPLVCALWAPSESSDGHAVRMTLASFCLWILVIQLRLHSQLLRWGLSSIRGENGKPERKTLCLLLLERGREG